MNQASYRNWVHPSSQDAYSTRTDIYDFLSAPSGTSGPGRYGQSYSHHGSGGYDHQSSQYQGQPGTNGRYGSDSSGRGPRTEARNSAGGYYAATAPFDYEICEPPSPRTYLNRDGSLRSGLGYTSDWVQESPNLCGPTSRHELSSGGHRQGQYANNHHSEYQDYYGHHYSRGQGVSGSHECISRGRGHNGNDHVYNNGNAYGYNHGHFVDTFDGHGSNVDSERFDFDNYGGNNRIYNAGREYYDDGHGDGYDDDECYSGCDEYGGWGGHCTNDDYDGDDGYGHHHDDYGYDDYGDYDDNHGYDDYEDYDDDYGYDDYNDYDD